MKKTLSLLLVFFLLYPAFSQHSSSDSLHKVIKQSKVTKKITVTPASAISELLLQLQKSMTVSKKNNLLYSIAAGSLNYLKIDSAII